MRERVFKVKKIEDDTYDAKAIVSKNGERALVSIKYEIIDDMVNVSVDFQTLSIMK